VTATVEGFLKTGEEYRGSLRDGREVWYRGERVADVTTHHATADAIDLYADLYDQQRAPETAEVLTYAREDGRQVSTCWLVPRTKADLARKRAFTEHVAWHTCGLMGRQPDIIAWTQIGLLAVLPTFRKHSSELAENLARYTTEAQEGNIHLAGVIIEPQGGRARSAMAGEDRAGVLQVVKETREGIVVRGARAVGSYAPQANELLVGGIYFPHVRPDESFWAAIPVDAPGLRLICRETTAAGEGASYDHPLASRGEESDAFVVFHDVLVPWDRVWSLRAPQLHDPALFAQVSRGEHWCGLTRLCVKAEIFAGVAQTLAEVLGLTTIPAIRDAVGKISQYAAILRAGALAAEELASPTEGDVLLPDVVTVRAMRAYALDTYPEIVHALQELCGQGLVMRFSERDFDNPTLAQDLEYYLEHNGVTARQKNLLLNFVWDLTTSAHAGRSALFENVNGLPAYLLRQLLYLEHEPDRQRFKRRVAGIIGLE
jgi:4-hydroxyphenylacetate 3-monooxygenase